MRWVINIPVWGEAYRSRWIERGYPAICAALKYAGFPEHRWIIHTDVTPADFPMLANDTVTFLPRPAGINGSVQLGRADKDGFHDAKVGEAVMFLNADMVPSVEIFAACETVFADPGKSFVSCPSIRTLDHSPRAGATGTELAAWSLMLGHPFTFECMWGSGKCKLPPYVIFNTDDSTVMHAFDLQPLAIYKRRFMELTAPTASEFIQAFPINEVHVVTDPAEMFIAEPAPPDIYYARFHNRTFGKRDVVAWARHSFSSDSQQKQFLEQIVLRGHPDPGAFEIAYDIYNEIRTARRFRMPITMPDRIALGLMVPRPIRRLFPKAFRQWFVDFEIPFIERGWPR